MAMISEEMASFWIICGLIRPYWDRIPSEATSETGKVLLEVFIL